VANPVEVKSRIGFVSEDQIFPASASINEMLDLYRSLYPNWDRLVERSLLDRFALAGGQRIGTLSKGQARQVALVCAVAHRPELLILDEPAGGLDPAARRELLETSMETLHRAGSAILFSSHHMNDVERLGGRIVLMEDGRVRLDDQLARLRDAVCVAVMPKDAVPFVGDLEATQGCLGVRPFDDDWHAVFRGAPESVRAELAARYGEPVRCNGLDLEDLFVELVGGKR
jgi:ABC-2 type transport system ATP-binding protein